MSGVGKLIERQASMWDIKDRLGVPTTAHPGSCLVAGVAYGPCLLMSRECGSGGGVVARLVGQRLGWHIYDREIVDEIARLSHTRDRLVRTVDEHVRSTWERTWAGLLLNALPGGDLALEEYLHCLRQVALSLAHHGDVVIVGRGAQYLLPPACALRVRMVAPLELRVQRVCESEGLKPDDARQKIRKLDSERASFVHRIFKSDVSSALNYDLVINTGDVSNETAVETVLAALHHKLSIPLSAPSTLAHA